MKKFYQYYYQDVSQPLYQINKKLIYEVLVQLPEVPGKLRKY